MPSESGLPESELKDLLGKASAPSSLDTDAIIAKSRARRRPKQVAAGAFGALAVAGIFVVAVQGLPLFQQPSTTSAFSSPESDMDAGASDSTLSESIKRAPAEKINLCGGTMADLAPSPTGLQLDMEFPATAPVGTAPIEGTVRLTNTGSRQVSGSTAAVPAITISQDGTVLWHSNGPMIMSLVIVDLAPGESLEYQTSITPVRCDVEDDLAESFREDLPALPAGDYKLSAVIDFTNDVPGETPELDLLSGPLAPITLG